MEEEGLCRSRMPEAPKACFGLCNRKRAARLIFLTASATIMFFSKHTHVSTSRNCVHIWFHEIFSQLPDQNFGGDPKKFGYERRGWWCCRRSLGLIFLTLFSLHSTRQASCWSWGFRLTTKSLLLLIRVLLVSARARSSACGGGYTVSSSWYQKTSFVGAFARALFVGSAPRIVPSTMDSVLSMISFLNGYIFWFCWFYLNKFSVGLLIWQLT